MFGRVRVYNSGFAVFTLASVLLSFDPFYGGRGALWLIGWRLLQAIGGTLLPGNPAGHPNPPLPPHPPRVSPGAKPSPAAARALTRPCPAGRAATHPRRAAVLGLH